jgi:hypothetical protein
MFIEATAQTRKEIGNLLAEGMIKAMEIEAQEMLDYCFWNLGYWKRYPYRDVRQMITILLYPSYVTALGDSPVST